MSISYRSMDSSIRTKEEWLIRWSTYYKDLNIPIPENFWWHLVRYISLVPVEVYEFDEGLLGYPEANPNMAKDIEVLI